MVESRFQYKKFVGYFFIIIGLLGVSYLGWVYVAWGKALPAFTAAHLLTEDARPIGYQGGFSKLLNPDQPEELSLEESNLLGINRVLGDYDNQDYDIDSLRLSVPRLDIVDAKVALDVSGNDESIYDDILTRAVAHLHKSAYPGEIGNAFLFGHSKIPMLAANDYESIFTNLPKVKSGDIVILKFREMKYTYQISQTGVVSPNDVFVMNQPFNRRLVTLMTCIPPGFSNSRYITIGELIDVEPL